ncbi:MAG: Zn-ribbon domain-containing OB-fold protein [Nitrososphaerota archaeon]
MSGLPVIKSRKLEITYNIPISKTVRFWEGLKEGKILATRCRNCGKLHFPPAADCGECLSSDMEWVGLSGRGRLITYSHVVVRPKSFQEEQPYTVAIAELEEGVKVLSWLTDVKRKDIRIGMELKMVPQQLSDGRIAYVFKPLTASV